MSVWATSALCAKIAAERAAEEEKAAAAALAIRCRNIRAWNRHCVRVPKCITEDDGDDYLRPQTTPTGVQRQKAAAVRWRKRGVKGELTAKVLAAITEQGPMTLAELDRCIPTSSKANLSHACITLAHRGQLQRAHTRVLNERRCGAGAVVIRVMMRVPIYSLPSKKQKP